jgi:UDP-N-acetylmuramate dehydrogenase
MTDPATPPDRSAGGAERSPGGADRAAIDRALAALGPLGDRAVPGGALGPMTTYRVGGAAAVLVTVTSYEDLSLVADAAVASALPVLVVGRGSNLLVAEAGFGGIAVVLDAARFGSITADGLSVRAGGAVALPALARRTVELGLTGLEWAVGVPGSVGGGVRMNAGGHGGDIAHSLESCRLVDLTRPGGPARTVAAAALDYRYRHSAIAPGQIVTEAVFGLAPGERDAGRRTIRQIVRWRREHQPGGQNAGSVFTNPADDSAGRLIDVAGLKGRRWGTAMVSPKHANFIQADPGGSSDDVKDLIDQVQAEVARFHGIQLNPEVRMVGFDSNAHSQVESKGGL